MHKSDLARCGPVMSYSRSCVLEVSESRGVHRGCGLVTGPNFGRIGCPSRKQKCFGIGRMADATLESLMPCVDLFHCLSNHVIVNFS